MADNGAGRDDGSGDGARAVGDGQGGGLFQLVSPCRGVLFETVRNRGAKTIGRRQWSDALGLGEASKRQRPRCAEHADNPHHLVLLY